VTSEIDVDVIRGKEEDSFEELMRLAIWPGTKGRPHIKEKGEKR
jgi:hypothetical protein